MTDHLCKGMTKVQIAAFERIAINAQPNCTRSVIDALLQKGVIERGEPEIRKDAMGIYEIPNFYVPVHHHYQWCLWCVEQKLVKLAKVVKE